MISLMLAVLGAWFLSLFAGPAIYAAMGLAGFAFLALAVTSGVVYAIVPLAALAVGIYALADAASAWAAWRQGRRAR